MEALADLNKIIKSLQEIEQEVNRQNAILKAIKIQIDTDNENALRDEKP